MTRDLSLGGLRRDLLFQELGVDHDAHVLADQDTTGLERHVPAEVKVFAVDPRGGAEAQSLTAPRILGLTLERSVERGLARDTMDRDVTDETKLLLDVALDPLSDERDRWIVRHVEEVW